ncbi:unnamed protein product [Arctogadus glacialis]
MKGGVMVEDMSSVSRAVQSPPPQSWSRLMEQEAVGCLESRLDSLPRGPILTISGHSRSPVHKAVLFCLSALCACMCVRACVCVCVCVFVCLQGA